MANQNHGQGQGGNKGGDKPKPGAQNFASMGDGKQREAATRTGQTDEDGNAVVGKGDAAGTDQRSASGNARSDASTDGNAGGGDKRASQDGKDASSNRSDK